MLWPGICFSTKSAAPASNPAILPQAFAGWQISQAARASADPAAADPVNAALLQEYGFTEFEAATYTRDDGRKLRLRAARFQDASDASGAFSDYRVLDMHEDKVVKRA